MQSMAGTLIPSAQRLVWAAKQPLGKAALGQILESEHVPYEHMPSGVDSQCIVIKEQYLPREVERRVVSTIRRDKESTCNAEMQETRIRFWVGKMPWTQS